MIKFKILFLSGMKVSDNLKILVW